jgi:hypothetical protein
MEKSTELDHKKPRKKAKAMGMTGIDDREPLQFHG